MIKLKKRYLITTLSLLIYFIGFLLLCWYLQAYCQTLIDSNDSITAFLKAYITVIYSIGFYLFLIFILSFIGYFISKFKKAEEYILGFKYLTWISLLIWFCFILYWTVIKK